MLRQEKRRELKKQKRKQLRQRTALELTALLQQQQEEVDEEAVIREVEKERAEHEEQERLWLLREEEAQKEWLRKQEEDELDRKRKEEARRLQGEEDLEEGWEYVEDGPAEIIWQGNEIIVKKPRKKVRKGTHSGTPLAIEQDKRKDGPISNPLPPQSAAFSSYQAGVHDDAADRSTNFGTEKDQRNCPFYIKTGVCRFGVRCSRVHPAFNEACTLLVRSMYTGAGLALEPIESLEVCAGIILLNDTSSRHHCLFTQAYLMERWPDVDVAAVRRKQPYDYTDEEVVQEYEEFYDDVHSEFIQFGEIVNFKVCRNCSPHLRGNVYVHYVSQESAMAAYNHMNGRFYAKKQISCEFVGVHKWKLAICGEFMRTNYKTCSHGTSCNFLHCFENPRREYEWADTDRPPPRFWQRKMAKLLGHAHVSDEEVDEKSRTYRESTHDTDRGRHRHNRELMYEDDHRRNGHSSREDDQRRGWGDRERKYQYEDDRTRRGSSTYDDRHRGRHHSRRERDFEYDEGSTRAKSASRDEPGCINDERWIAGDDHVETDDRGRRRDWRHRRTTYDDDDGGGHPGRHSPTPEHVSHHRSHRHRRRSRSPSSHKVRRSRSRDRSRASSQDGEEQDLKETRHRKERASKESKLHRRSGDDIHDSQLVSDLLERKGDEVAGKSNSESQHHQKASEDIRSRDLEGKVAGMVVSDENVSSELESQSGLQASLDVENLNQETKNSSSTETGLGLDLSTDDVQKSTSEWQSWRKAKKAKLKPMRVII